MNRTLLIIGAVIILLLILLLGTCQAISNKGGDGNGFEEPYSESSTIPAQDSSGAAGTEETQGSLRWGEEPTGEEKTLIDTGGIPLYNQ